MRYEIRETRVGDRRSAALFLTVDAKWVATINGRYSSGKMQFGFIQVCNGQYIIDRANGSHHAVVCIGHADGSREYLKWVGVNEYAPCTEAEAVEIENKYRNWGGLIPQNA